MPSQFSTIGFNVSSGEDLAALASRVAGEAERISTPPGEYLKWAPPSGEQLWLQITPDGDAMGMNPHFDGKSSIRLAVEAKVARPSHTPLDGTFLAWANPPAGAATGGDYPFVFDCPDAATHLDLPLPATVMAQVAAFAQQVSLYESADGVRVIAGSGGREQRVAVVHSVRPVLARRRAAQSARAACAHRRPRARGGDSRQRRHRPARTGGRSSRPSAAPSTSSSTRSCWPTLRVPATSSPDGSGCRAAC